MVNELQGRRARGLRELQRENLFAVAALRANREEIRRVAPFDRAVQPRLAFLVRHLHADLLVVVARGALPWTEPARGALGARQARPNIVDRSAEGARENEIVAAEAASGLRGHMPVLSFF